MPQAKMTKREHIQKLIAAMQRRLEQLEIDQAQLGYGAPPQIATEISDIQDEIKRQQAALQALEVFDTLNDAGVGSKGLDRRDESNYEHRLNVMVATVMATVTEVSNVKKFVADEIAGIKTLIYRVILGAAIVAVLWSIGFFSLLHWGT